MIHHTYRRSDPNMIKKVRLCSIEIPITHTLTKLTNATNYTIEELRSTKEMLNQTKSKMDEIYLTTNTARAKNWKQMQDIINSFGRVRFMIMSKYNAKHVTNAWLKYYEIFVHFNIIPMGDVKVFFNAELPGAALSAFNHYMRTLRNDKFDWFASSLVDPDKRMFGDFYGYYKYNRTNWLMSPTNNGDVTNADNLLDYERRIGPGSPVNGVHLYSHDAGMDVSNLDGQLGFNEQETINAQVHLGCALAGLMTLRVGGNFIAKQYTFFETFTWNLILYYASLFKEFYFFKPLTSKPYNSELYLVGKGFKGLPSNDKEFLLNRLRNFTIEPLFPRGMVPDAARSFLAKAAYTVFKQQVDFIQDNLKLFEQYNGNLYTLRRRLSNHYHKAALKWLRMYPVVRLGYGKALPSK